MISMPNSKDLKRHLMKSILMWKQMIALFQNMWKIIICKVSSNGLKLLCFLLSWYQIFWCQGADICMSTNKELG